MAQVVTKATRESFGEALCELAKTNEDIIVLDADLAAATKTSIAHLLIIFTFAPKLLQARRCAPGDSGQVQLSSSPRGYCTLCKISVHLNQPHTVLHLNRKKSGDFERFLRFFRL